MGGLPYRTVLSLPLSVSRARLCTRPSRVSCRARLNRIHERDFSQPSYYTFLGVVLGIGGLGVVLSCRGGCVFLFSPVAVVDELGLGRRRCDIELWVFPWRIVGFFRDSQQESSIFLICQRFESFMIVVVDYGTGIGNES